MPPHLSTQPRGHLGNSQGPTVLIQGLDEMGPTLHLSLGSHTERPQRPEVLGSDVVTPRQHP